MILLIEILSASSCNTPSYEFQVREMQYSSPLLRNELFWVGVLNELLWVGVLNELLRDSIRKNILSILGAYIAQWTLNHIYSYQEQGLDQGLSFLKQSTW